MRLKEFTLGGLSPTDLALWNEAVISPRIAVVDETMRVQFELLPPASFFAERHWQKFVKIEPLFSGNSLKIMRYLLTSSKKQPNRKRLMEHVWEKRVPTYGAVRQAIRRLNTDLAEQDFGYVIKGSQNGIYRVIPIET